MIKIGIIGMSPGNAHPYSWSSIINGTFNAEEINRIGYPGVLNYLIANKDTLGIPAARVTHVWTQDRLISESIAKNSNIANVVDTLEGMIGEVDAVLLSRDDPENHVGMARPFIEAGIPIFVDKPLATNHKDLDWFANESSKGKLIMSCSSMRFANECRIVKQEVGTLGELCLTTAVGKKDWNKYGVHLMEAVFALLDDPVPVSVRHASETGKDIVVVELENGIRSTFLLFMDITPTLQISLFGKNGWRLMDIKNSYSMFRDNIIEFVRSVEEGKSRIEFDKTYRIISTLIGANESLNQGGIAIRL